MLRKEGVRVENSISFFSEKLRKKHEWNKLVNRGAGQVFSKIDDLCTRSKDFMSSTRKTQRNVDDERGTGQRLHAFDFANRC